jgi:hypothetical protein
MYDQPQAADQRRDRRFDGLDVAEYTLHEPRQHPQAGAAAYQRDPCLQPRGADCRCPVGESACQPLRVRQTPIRYAKADQQDLSVLSPKRQIPRTVKRVGHVDNPAGDQFATLRPCPANSDFGFATRQAQDTIDAPVTVSGLPQSTDIVRPALICGPPSIRGNSAVWAATVTKRPIVSEPGPIAHRNCVISKRFWTAGEPLHTMSES